jgi:hypothetical protein
VASLPNLALALLRSCPWATAYEWFEGDGARGHCVPSIIDAKYVSGDLSGTLVYWAMESACTPLLAYLRDLFSIEPVAKALRFLAPIIETKQATWLVAQGVNITNLVKAEAFNDLSAFYQPYLLAALGAGDDVLGPHRLGNRKLLDMMRLHHGASLLLQQTFATASCQAGLSDDVKPWQVRGFLLGMLGAAVTCGARALVQRLLAFDEPVKLFELSCRDLATWRDCKDADLVQSALARLGMTTFSAKSRDGVLEQVREGGPEPSVPRAPEALPL